MEANYVFQATGINNLNFNGLKFAVASGTAHAQTGGFIYLSTCNFARITECVFDASIPNVTTQKESTISLVNTPNCNHLLIENNQFKYFFGNACGANNGAGTGALGLNVSILGNLFYNGVDTGVGTWTNASDVSIVGNIFYRDDYSTSYNGVHIDVAGAQNLTITGNSFTGNAIGVRCISNLGYADQLVTIGNNTFQNQVNGSSEPATCIKISNYLTTAGGGENNFNFSITGNTFNCSVWGINLNIVNTDTSQVTVGKIDDNVFSLRNNGVTGVNFSSTNTLGNLKLSPGKNTFIGAGTGSVSVTANNVNYPAYVSINGGHENLAYTKNDFTATYTSGVNIVGSFYLGRGLYAVAGGINTYTGATTTIRIRDLSSNAKVNVLSITTANANTTFDTLWNSNDIEGVYQVTFDVSGSMSAGMYYLQLVRLI
jgi:hypothetical protein